MEVSDRDTPVTIGRVFADKYRVDGLLGNGAMGVVFAATHLQLETRVAIKLLRADMFDTHIGTARLLREARATARIKSENVARILDTGTVDRVGLYVVMEHLEGSDLAALMQKSPGWSPAEVVALLLQACEGVRAAHALGIIHRDLKPSNLFVTRDPSGAPHLKVLDFGLSKLVDPKSGSPVLTRGGAQLTRPDSQIGSPIYASPEQLLDPRTVDTRTDIWSLGVILFEMLTGHPPFEAKTLPELCALILNQKPPPLRALRPGLPPGLEAIVERCLQRLPAQRYATVDALVNDLTPFTTPAPVPASEPVAPTGPPSPPPSPLLSLVARPVLPRWIVATASLFLALALVVALGRNRAATPPPVAPVQPRLPDAGMPSLAPPPPVAAQSCSACLAANCPKEYTSCMSTRACRFALAGYDACVQPAADAAPADCARMLRTRNPAGRRLTRCMLGRQGDAAGGRGKCANVCGAGTVGGDVPVKGDARLR